jgi:hypothetical protein
VIRELLLPRTDAGVAGQVLATAVAWIALVYFAHRQRELVLFISGVSTMLFAWYALRAVH